MRYCASIFGAALVVLAVIWGGFVVFNSVANLFTPDPTFQKTEIGDSSKPYCSG